MKVHWLPGGARFWYRVQTGPQQWEVVLVDAEKGTRTLASDAARRALGQEQPLPSQADLPRRSRHTGEATTIAFCNRSAVEVELFWLAFDGRRRSYGKIVPGGRRPMSTYEGHVWLVLDAQGRELALVEAGDEPGRVEITAVPLPPQRTIRGPPRGASPDGKWLATIKNHNVWLRHAASGGEFAFSTDGTADDGYIDGFHWSPDSKRIVAMQVAPGQEHKVYFVESSPPDELQPKPDGEPRLSQAGRSHRPLPAAAVRRLARRRPLP